MISFGFPLLAINLLRQSRNNGADNPLTISKINVQLELQNM